MSTKKIVRFSESEKIIFSELYCRHKFEIGTGKDRASREKNDAAWTQITNEFNRHPNIMSAREPFQLKKLLANNKQLLNPIIEKRNIIETEKKCPEDETDSNDLPSDGIDKKMRTGDGDKESSGSNIGNPETHYLFPKRPRIAWDPAHTAHTAHTSQPQKKLPTEEVELSVENLQILRLQKLIEQDAELANARLIHENEIAFMNIRNEEELLRLKLQQTKELFALQRKTALVKLKTQRIAQERLMKMENDDLLY